MGNAQASRARGRERRGAEEEDPYRPPGANIAPYAAPVTDPLADDRIHRSSKKPAAAQRPPGGATAHPSQAQQRTNRQRGHGSQDPNRGQTGASSSHRKHGSAGGSHPSSKDSRGGTTTPSSRARSAAAPPSPIPPPPAPVGHSRHKSPRATSTGGTSKSKPQPPPSTSHQAQSTGTSTARKSSGTRSSRNRASAAAPEPTPPEGTMTSRREKMKGGQFQSAASMKASDIPQPDSSSGMSFDELYRLKDVLGTGAFSTVREGYHRRHRDKMFAIKCVNRSKLTEEDAAALLDEVAILKELRHAHIIRLYDFFEEPGNYYLVMEKMTGGELFDRIVAKAYYNEKEARDTCKIILDAVGYCHLHKVAHRDLKPENLLLVSDSSDSSVKIADFGFAKKVLAPKTLTTQCGTPGYVAPEILEGVPYDTKSDMWSVGVILYILLGGYPPFIENNQRELFKKIRRGDYEFHEEYWGAVSDDAKDLISSLLTVNPAKRLDARQALANKWICDDDDKLEGHDLGLNLEQLKKFNAKRKFKAAVSTVMAVNKLQSLGKDFLRNLDD